MGKWRDPTHEYNHRKTVARNSPFQMEAFTCHAFRDCNQWFEVHSAKTDASSFRWWLERWQRANCSVCAGRHCCDVAFYQCVSLLSFILDEVHWWRGRCQLKTKTYGQVPAFKLELFPTSGTRLGWTDQPHVKWHSTGARRHWQACRPCPRAIFVCFQCSLLNLLRLEAVFIFISVYARDCENH